jgi:hypothetical protein
MEVEWRLTPDGSGTIVAVVHDLSLRWPIVGRAVADRIIGPRFVEPIAAATLRTIKRLVEQRPAGAGAAAGPDAGAAAAGAAPGAGGPR